MKVVLLHKDVYIPEWVNSKVKYLLEKYNKFTLSQHVINHATRDVDRSHGYTLDKLNESLRNAIGKSFEAFEVELIQYNEGDKWLVSKICIRIPYSSNQEACLSIRPYRDPITKKIDVTNAHIITTWLNSTEDAHYTLDESKYSNKLKCDILGI